MKSILNFIPLVLFFIFLNFYDMFMAVKVLMISATIITLLLLILYKKVEKMELFSFLMILIFGGLTLFFHDAAFIKWKVTLINFLFAAGLLISLYLFKKNLLQAMLGKEVVMSEQAWKLLNLFWVIFFIIIGLASLYVTYYMSDEFFGTFKVFILPGATVLMTFITFIFMNKQSKQDGE